MIQLQENGMQRVSIDVKILSSIKKLSPVEKLKLVNFLLLSLDKPNFKVEKAWEDESEDRIKAYTRGKISSVPYEIFMKRFSRNK